MKAVTLFCSCGCDQPLRQKKWVCKRSSSKWGRWRGGGMFCVFVGWSAQTIVRAANQTFYLTQSQYTDTGPTSPSADPTTPGATHTHWYDSTPAPAGFEPGIFRSRGGRLNHLANEAVWGGMNKLCSCFCCILSPKGNKLLIFQIQKNSLSWRFSVSCVCTFSIVRHFILASVWFCRLKCRQECLCLCWYWAGVGKSWFCCCYCFPDVLRVAARITTEKVHNVGEIASHPVSDCEPTVCCLISEIFLFPLDAADK